jgi:hypothetical protein
MKFIVGYAILVSFPAVPAIAQNQADPIPAATSRLSLDTPISVLVADPSAKSVLDTTFPGLTSHSAYDQFKGMTLKQLQPMSQGVITDEKLSQAGALLTAIK